MGIPDPFLPFSLLPSLPFSLLYFCPLSLCSWPQAMDVQVYFLHGGPFRVAARLLPRCHWWMRCGSLLLQQHLILLLLLVYCPFNTKWMRVHSQLMSLLDNCWALQNVTESYLKKEIKLQINAISPLWHNRNNEIKLSIYLRFAISTYAF